MDEAILAQINQSNEPDEYEPTRSDDSECECEHEHSDDEHGHGHGHGHSEDREEYEEVLRASKQSGPQTGIKGVRNDFKQHQQREREIQERKKQELIEKIKKFSITLRNTNKEEDEFDELDDDDFAQEYYNKRMQQMMTSSNNRPTYGKLSQIKVTEYLNVIDKTEKTIPVIIHLFQNYIPECRKINQCLEVLAQKYIHARFVWIVSTEADENFDDIALPTILVYKNGDLILNLVRVTDNLYDDYTIIDVENLLLQQQGLHTSDAGANSTVSVDELQKKIKNSIL